MSKLFSPLQVGACQLQHRVIMAPLTRFRSNEDYVPIPAAKEYYTQRASVPGTLIIAEATYISPKAAGYPNAPGIWSAEQIARWKEITDSVHAKGSFVFLQIWALGRSSDPENLKANGFDFVSSSPVPIQKNDPIPRELSETEIREYIDDFAQAGRNAISAGFDGVELHGANGFLIDQFTQDTSNQRTDSWGGSIENRSRFAVEVTRAMVDAIGAGRVAIKLSPWSADQGMRMNGLKEQFTHLISQLKHLKLAYLHLTNPRVSIEDEPLVPAEETATDENAPFIQAWGNVSPVLLGGGYSADSAKRAVDVEYQDQDIGTVFGRFFISNPDLPLRAREDIPFTPYDRDTFYTPLSEKGYVDYPFHEPVQAQA
ncbi:NADH-dependent flavin oxidoreductase [Penicillium canescens]|nr:NADH-dependent flavin oxidoreductase [Penicillium canescens]